MAKPSTSAPASNDKPALKYSIAKRIVVPTMKVEVDTPIFVRFEQAIEARKKIEEVEGKSVEKMIEIARVTNLETGEICEIVAGTVLMSELAEAYAENGYIGKCFRICKKNVAGKRYKAYELDEITVEA